MHAGLTGQFIGSIRRITFNAGSPASHSTAPLVSAATTPVALAATPAATPVAPAPAMIEIETKSGRYFHWSPEPAAARVWLRAGPARSTVRPVAGVSDVRTWEDLTAMLAAAFDGRPVITAVNAIDTVPTESGEATDGCLARAWVIELSTGVALRCSCSSDGRLSITLVSVSKCGGRDAVAPSPLDAAPRG